MKSPARFLRDVSLLVALTSPAIGQLTQTELDDIGFTSLKTRLGAAMPTGAGISLTQTEAAEGTSYRPDVNQFPGHNFTFPAGGATGTSGHANLVGQFIYGTGSLAPAIGTAADEITSYSAITWISSVLNAGNTSLLPAEETNDIQNHSWVGTNDNTTSDTTIVRRMDYAIQRDDFVAVFGLNNGSGNPVPALMAGAYNGITVGLSNGQHSSGTSVIEGARTRPDIVVPTSSTSVGTATVSSAAALMIETARSSSALSNGDRSFVVKSLLMAGATRDESEFSRAWVHSATQPLDATYGAGELNIDNSYQILTAGEAAASVISTAAATGWDLGLTAATNNYYYFDVSAESQVSAALVWNRTITAADTPGGGISYQFNSSLADLNLHLYSASGFDLGTELAISASSIDNVELITTLLGPGRYVWEVSSSTPLTQYGLAWQSITSVPEPSSTMLITVMSLAIFRRRRQDNF